MGLSKLLLLLKVLVVISHRGLHHNVILPSIGVTVSELIVEIGGSKVRCHLIDGNHLLLLWQRRFLLLAGTPKVNFGVSRCL